MPRRSNPVVATLTFDKLKKYFPKKDCHVIFNFRVFLKYFTYHFLFMFILGPLVAPIVYLIEGAWISGKCQRAPKSR